MYAIRLKLHDIYNSKFEKLYMSTLQRLLKNEPLASVIFWIDIKSPNSDDIIKKFSAKWYDIGNESCIISRKLPDKEYAWFDALNDGDTFSTRALNRFRETYSNDIELSILSVILNYKTLLERVKLNRKVKYRRGK